MPSYWSVPSRLAVMAIGLCAGAALLVACDKKPAMHRVSKVTRIASIPIGGVVRPRIRLDTAMVEAGRASVVRLAHDGVSIALTVHHLFGPPGGLTEQLSPEAIYQRYRGFEALSLLDGDTTASLCNGARMLALAGTAPFDQESDVGDIAAFDLVGCPNIPALDLAPAAPEAGAQVRLIGRMDSAGRPFDDGVVESVEGGRFWVRYEVGADELAGCDGAPVVDAEGRVLGIHLSAMTERGSVLGLVLPTAKFRGALEAAVRGEK